MLLLILFVISYHGLSFFSLTIDNSNIAFLILVIGLYPIINYASKFETKSNHYSGSILLLIILLYLLFQYYSLLYLFINYEFLIVLLFYIIMYYNMSFYRIRTGYFFFLYSVLGSFNFNNSLYYLVFSLSIISLIIIIPFLIKIPCFPFYYWLPEVHCESNTSISLYLAALLLKLAIFGIIRFILCAFYLSFRFLVSLFINIVLIGCVIINASFFRYYDLKKIIALSSILHLNLLFYSMLSLNSSGLYCAIVICVSHSLSSMGLFLFMGLLINKTNTRLLDSFFYMSSSLRYILLMFILANNSFPGSLNFIGEILALLSIISINVLFSLFFLMVSFLSTLFWFLILNRKLPFSTTYYKLISTHNLLLVYLIILIYFIGVYFLF